MKKAISVSLLLLFCLLIAGCYEYGPPPSGYVGPAPDDHHHHYEPGYDTPQPPPGAIGPAHDHSSPVYPDNPPPPSGAVGPADRHY